LRRTNVLIRHDSRSEIFVTVVYGMLEPGTGCLTYANGGHSQPLWWRAATGTVENLPARGMLLGTFDDIILQEAEIVLAPGDVLILFTDGLTEMWNARRRQFGDSRLREALAAAACQPDATAQQVLDTILESAHAFAGLTPQADDVTLVIVRRNPE
jgi:phosphoserine phosphatase RsbU/P